MSRTVKNKKLQQHAKYNRDLLDFTENLDLKRKFNVAFWLFSTR